LSQAAKSSGSSTAAYQAAMDAYIAAANAYRAAASGATTDEIVNKTNRYAGIHPARLQGEVRGMRSVPSFETNGGIVDKKKKVV
jgi:hypothetical protein